MQIDDIISFDPAEAYEFTDNEVDCATLPQARRARSAGHHARSTATSRENWDVSQDGLHLHLPSEAGRACSPSGKPVTARGRGVLAPARRDAQQDARLHHHPVRLHQGQRRQADHARPTTRPLVIQLPDASGARASCCSACPPTSAASSRRRRRWRTQANNDLGNAWLKTNSAGAGAYQLISWAASDHVTLDANPHCHAAAAASSASSIRHVADPSRAAAAAAEGRRRHRARPRPRPAQAGERQARTSTSSPPRRARRCTSP